MRGERSLSSQEPVQLAQLNPSTLRRPLEVTENLHGQTLRSALHGSKCRRAAGPLTFLGLVPHDALQIDAGSGLTGAQTDRVPLQGP